MFILYNKFRSENISGDYHRNWLAELPGLKRSKIISLSNKLDQLRSLVGCQLLKTGMRLLGETNFHLSELEYTVNGKPYTKRPVYFTISHADNLVCCALSDSHIGIDTEPRAKTKQVDLTRYFTDEELDQIKKNSKNYPDLWTRKEAICKAHSDRGLADIPKINLTKYRAILHDRQWWVYPVDLHHSQITHLACDQPVSELTICEIDIP
jgi:phosphopantetheinyl transferase